MGYNDAHTVVVLVILPPIEPVGTSNDKFAKLTSFLKKADVNLTLPNPYPRMTWF